MKANAVYKILDGKLVKVFLDFEKDKILAVKIFGDFFLYPEEGIEKIESGLAGKKIVQKEIEELVQKIVLKEKIELFGLSASGLATAILMAKESGKNG